MEELGTHRAAILQELDRILVSPGFVGASRLQSFLRFVVNRQLDGLGSEIKESLIGVEVYRKRPDYDPRLDSTVRVEASKLRNRLEQYYENEGHADPVRISVPKGGYVPHFDIRARQAPIDLPPRETVAPAQSSGFRMWWVLAALVLAVAVWTATHLRQQAEVRGPTAGARLSRLTPANVYCSDPALSPDGRFIVYTSDADRDGILNLWMQPLGGGSPTRLTHTGFDDRMPDISRDGTEVIFRSELQGGILALVSATGGPVTPIPTAVRARHPRFSPTHRLVAYWMAEDEETLDRGSLYLLNLDQLGKPGFYPVRLLGEFATARRPVWSDNGRQIVTLGTWQSDVPEREYDAWVLPLDGTRPVGQPVKTGLIPLLTQIGLVRSTAERSQVTIGDWRDGWIYFTAQSGDAVNVFRARLDPEDFEVRGDPQRVTLGSGREVSPRLGPDGRMVFSSVQISYDIYGMEIPSTVHGKAAEAPAPVRLTSEPGMNFRISVTPRGNGVAWEQRLLGKPDQVVFLDFQSGRRNVLGAHAVQPPSHVVLSPDGAIAAYRVFEGTKQAIYVEPRTGGPARRLCEDCGAPSDWTSDGSRVLYVTGGRPNRIGIVEVATGRSQEIFAHPSYGLFGAKAFMNRDGDGWIAFYADNGPRTRQIFTAPINRFVAGPSSEWNAVTDGAHWDLSPAWSEDGNTIYFVSQRDRYRCIYAQALDPSTKRRVGLPWPVAHFHTPGQTLMRSVTYRGAEAVMVEAGRLFFTLDERDSALWLLE